MSKFGVRLLSGLREVLDTMDETIARQQFLEQHSPKCPHCDSNKVHLLLINRPPAKWVCKVCNARFNYEPEPLVE